MTASFFLFWHWTEDGGFRKHGPFSTSSDAELFRSNHLHPSASCVVLDSRSGKPVFTSGCKEWILKCQHYGEFCLLAEHFGLLPAETVFYVSTTLTVWGRKMHRGELRIGERTDYFAFKTTVRTTQEHIEQSLTAIQTVYKSLNKKMQRLYEHGISPQKVAGVTTMEYFSVVGGFGKQDEGDHPQRFSVQFHDAIWVGGVFIAGSLDPSTTNPLQQVHHPSSTVDTTATTAFKDPTAPSSLPLTAHWRRVLLARAIGTLHSFDIPNKLPGSPPNCSWLGSFNGRLQACFFTQWAQGRLKELLSAADMADLVSAMIFIRDERAHILDCNGDSSSSKCIQRIATCDLQTKNIIVGGAALHEDHVTIVNLEYCFRASRLWDLSWLVMLSDACEGILLNDGELGLTSDVCVNWAHSAAQAMRIYKFCCGNAPHFTDEEILLFPSVVQFKITHIAVAIPDRELAKKIIQIPLAIHRYAWLRELLSGLLRSVRDEPRLFGPLPLGNGVPRVLYPLPSAAHRELLRSGSQYKQPVALLFCGTFSPVHRGHINTLLTATRHFAKTCTLLGCIVGCCNDAYCQQKLGSQAIPATQRTSMHAMAASSREFLREYVNAVGQTEGAATPIVFDTHEALHITDLNASGNERFLQRLKVLDDTMQALVYQQQQQDTDGSNSKKTFVLPPKLIVVFGDDAYPWATSILNLHDRIDAAFVGRSSTSDMSVMMMEQDQHGGRVSFIPGEYPQAYSSTAIREAAVVKKSVVGVAEALSVPVLVSHLKQATPALKLD